MTPCRDLNELTEPFRSILKRAIAAAILAGLDPVVTETYRTPERQAELYAQGRNRNDLGKIVTYCDGIHRLSRHQFRDAADVCPRVNGEIDWAMKSLFGLWGEIAEEHGLKWGGSFRDKRGRPMYDGPHVEMPRGVA